MSAAPTIPPLLECRGLCFARNEEPVFGPIELLIVLAIVLLLFGARRLPKLGRELGSGMREFKDGIVHSSSDAEATSDAPPSLNAPADRPSARGPAQT